jgi:hypothetical protein
MGLPDTAPDMAHRAQRRALGVARYSEPTLARKRP